jgi:glycosyltransferase involved in cell wall biosynthesis
VSRTVLMVHPSTELYGSDRMFAESSAALADAGWRVVVTLPAAGELAAVLRAQGARVVVCPTPVLRKAALRPVGFARLVLDGLRAVRPMLRLLRHVRPHAMYVNTVTVPLWLLLGRLLRLPVLAHVHEAEDEVPAPVRAALAAPLLLATTVVANSQATARSICTAIPRLAARTRVVYNGVAGPPPGGAPNASFVTPGAPNDALGAPPDGPHNPLRLVLVGRLSPRKGTDVAVDAVQRLHNAGYPVTLQLVGSAFEGYDWFVDQLREQITASGLTEHVRFAGFTADVWQAYAEADVALVPSRVEPFGNTSVEAQLAGVPVIVSDAQGLPETVDGGTHGVVVSRDDAQALAEAVQELQKNWPAAAARAEAAQVAAAARFDPAVYWEAIAAELDRISKPRGR